MKNSFWLTNISKINICLSDLNLTIKSNSTVNLLDKKHYNCTLEQIEKSVSTGSISKKKDKLFIRQSPPEFTKKNTLVTADEWIPSRGRSIYSIKEQQYEELQVSDEEFAKENADIAELDNAKQIVKG